MSDAPDTADERYESLCRTFLSHPDVTRESDDAQRRQGFGSAALKVDDSIFAMLVKGRLVVKLPRHRVDALVASGEGERYDPGRGRIMKEWLAVESHSEEAWLRLTSEAMEFVSQSKAA